MVSSQTEMPPAIDYSDVVFPGRQWDFLRRAGLSSIYVIQSLDLVKVGMASEVIPRLKSMTCDNPHGIELKAVFRVPNALVHWTEMYCHEKLVAHHHHGEWFRVDAQTAVQVVEAVCEIASAARGQDLIMAKPETEWRVKRQGPPASLRLKPMMADMIEHPVVGEGSFESRKYQARKRAQEAVS